ncbi:MAG: hypothetical protein CM15mP83_0020 [Flavobacteriaceae bacterium]|nr:MAG: hypothetical protein CM15mP83_0020 [Flavobacteriaceae bacterium]
MVCSFVEKTILERTYEEDKISAYQTLYTCLISVAKLMAPIAPFYADRLYRDLDATTEKEQYASVHLAYFPTANNQCIAADLEKKMQLAQRIVSLVLSIRKRKIKCVSPSKGFDSCARQSRKTSHFGSIGSDRCRKSTSKQSKFSTMLRRFWSRKSSQILKPLALDLVRK